MLSNKNLCLSIIFSCCLISIIIPTIVWFTVDKPKYESSHGSEWNCTLISYYYYPKSITLSYTRDGCDKIMKQNVQEFEFVPINSNVTCYSNGNTCLDYYYIQPTSKWNYFSFFILTSSILLIPLVLIFCYVFILPER